MDLSSPQFNQRDLTLEESQVLFRDWTEMLTKDYMDSKNARFQMRITPEGVIIGTIQ